MHEPRVIARGLAFPEGPTLSVDGRTLYIVNLAAPFLSRLDLATESLTREWATLPDGGVGNGMTLGPDGALYVADVAARRIARVSPDDGATTTITDTTDTGDTLRGPNDLVFDAHGGLFFTDPAGSWDDPIGCVYHVRPCDGTASLVAGGIQFPNGLVVSPDGQTLYVAETARKRVLAIDLSHPQTGASSPRSATKAVPTGCVWGRTAVYTSPSTATAAS